MHFRNTLLATALGQAALAQAVDWPQWRGPTRDGILPAKGIMLTKLPDQPKVVWKIKSGEGLSSPVVYLRERSPRQDARPLGPSPCRDL